MRAMPLKRSGRVLALTLTLSSLSMFSQAEVVGQATASVSNFGFSLRDLNPDDGVTPTFTARHWWNDSAQVSVLKYKDGPSLDILESGFSSDRGLRSSSVDLFNPIPLATNLPGGDARAEVKPGGVSAAVTLNSDGFIGANYSLYPYGTWVDDYKTSPVWVGGPEIKSDASTVYERWALSPGSEVTVSGTIKLDASVNAEAVTDLIPGDTVRAAAFASALVNFRAGLTDSGMSICCLEIIKTLPDYAYSVLKVQELATDALGSLGRDHAQGSMEQSFSYIIRNHSAVNMNMYFGLSVAARANAAPVPEPTTWALLLVGLSSVGAASAWRRRTGKQ